MDRGAKCLALSGGVGGAKLALGLARALSPEQLTVLVNTGDDFLHLGLNICPDLDTVMYTLSGRGNREAGWGLEGETWNFLDALKALGEESWFQLGDRDLATHVMRTRLLEEGHSLTEVTRELCRRFSVPQDVLPMSDRRVATMVHLKEGGVLPFQQYFVRDRCEPAVSGFHFDGIEEATPPAPLFELLADPQLHAIVICPSNPFVSIDPILEVPGLRQALMTCSAPVVAVTPIVGGQAIKGPTAKMMKELGMPTTPQAVAGHYGELLDGFVVDNLDGDAAAEVEGLGIPTTVTDTVMVTLDDRVRLARNTLEFASRLHPTTRFSRQDRA